MAKKYLKNSKGIVKAITTNSLQLEKPLLNENYDIEVHNRNMDKLDTTIQGLKGKVDSIDITVQDLGDRIDNVGNIVEELELKAENVSITDTNNVFSSSNVEGALNELFQYANNGKEIIADAIGEPLSAEDTFTAMGSDINGLLSTFKTNMMNNGVTVESGDKFKQLIDKIPNSGGLDITSATELPSTGRENQICVITDNPTDKFVLSYPGFSDFTNVDKSVICGEMSISPSYASTLINTGPVSQRYNFLKFIQNSNLKPSYIYQNNDWNKFTLERSYLINNKEHVTDSEFGGFYNLDSVSSYATFNSNGLDFNVTKQYGKVRICTANKVDFSLFNNMVITRSSSTSYHTTYVYRTDTQLTSSSYHLYEAISPYITISKPTQYQVGVGYLFETTVYDISDWDGVHYLSVDIYSSSSGSVDTMISDLYFY